MGIHVIHHRQPTQPVNTSGDYCGLCWTPPGREHGLACPAAPRPGLAFPDAARVFAGLLVGLPIGAALWTITALIAWSL